MLYIKKWDPKKVCNYIKKELKTPQKSKIKGRTLSFHGYSSSPFPSPCFPLPSPVPVSMALWVHLSLWALSHFLFIFASTFSCLFVYSVLSFPDILFLTFTPEDLLYRYNFMQDCLCIFEIISTTDSNRK